ncbi:Gfo/Idh/MocA family protein [Streptomyces kanamyceticus]|uniref:Gfo/Idh/MocA family oxidoreductase n=1 Tax=Streptomyces kanamyceticus TaxID=1967 RepID=A0A5J6GQE8_STRKN|nr:Gfo/Idh/MocA family oxidoreductase [Streptomyces kanamyceticus]QEU96275.1 gfo/Idh/MocA family oxidoreductase [Streptomyces kanamyceticus]
MRDARHGPVRVGVLGCADIALRRMLPVLAAEACVELVAVASRDADKAARTAARFGCDGARGYDALLRRDDVDAVYIPLPPALHRHWITEALGAGKHVLCEKPLSTSYDDTLELLKLARSRQLVLAENFMFPHHSQHRAVRELLQEDVVGTVQVFSSSFGVPPLDPAGFRYRPDLGGGALLDTGVYPLLAAQLYLGGELEALGATLRIDERTGVDVAGTALLSAADGTAAQVSFGFDHSYRAHYALWGTRGRLTVERAFTPPEQLRPPVRIQQQDRVTELTLAPDHQVRNSVRAFAEAVVSGPLGPAEEELTLRQARLVEDIRLKARRFSHRPGPVWNAPDRTHQR